MLSDALRDILLEAETAEGLLQLLFNARKDANSKFSIAYFAREAEIPSRGLASDYLSGRRKPSPKHWDGIAAAFLLNGLAKEILFVLLGQSALKDDASVKESGRKLQNLRKALATSQEVLPKRAKGGVLFLELFSAFGLFQNRPTRDQLRKLFGVEYHIELDTLLHLLQNQGIIELVDGHFVVVKDSFRLQDSEDKYSHIQLMKAAIADSRNQVEKWYNNSELALFTSGVVSVRKDKYKAMMRTIRDAILKAHAEVETSDADMLVRFNLQIYPSPFTPLGS